MNVYIIAPWPDGPFRSPQAPLFPTHHRFAPATRDAERYFNGFVPACQPESRSVARDRATVHVNAPPAAHPRAGWLLVPIVCLLVACGQKQDTGRRAGSSAAAGSRRGRGQARPGRADSSCPGGSRRRASREVRARVAGILQKRLFEEGSDVKAGQALFQIDAAPYEAAVASARAALARAQANLTQASAQVRALQAAARGQCGQPPGLRQRGRRAEAGRGRRRRRQGQPADGADQPRLCLGDRADLRPHRPRAGHRRRARRPGRGDAAGRRAADRSDVRQLHAVDRPKCCACARAFESGSVQARRRTRTAHCVQLVLEDGSVNTTSRASCCSPTSRVDPTSGQMTLRAEVPNPDRLAAARHVRAGAARAGRRRPTASSCRSRR